MSRSASATTGRGILAIVFSLWLLAPGPLECQDASLTGELVVYNAGSLAVPFHRLLEAFGERHPDVRADQEHSGSLAAVRKLTELGRIPDVLALADRTLFPTLLQPRYVTWNVTFVRNAMVLAVAPDQASRSMPTPTSWPDSLLKPGVRWGFADPMLDPAGYRAFMVFDLAERHYERPGLAARLREHANRRYQRPKSVDLVALLQLGELDYAWLYASVARFHGLPVVELPSEVNLSDQAFADTYRLAVVEVPGRSSDPHDRVTVTGSPIELALSIPTEAEHPEVAEAFVRFVLSSEGQAILEDAGLMPIQPPVFSGIPPAGLLR